MLFQGVSQPKSKHLSSFPLDSVEKGIRCVIQVRSCLWICRCGSVGKVLVEHIWSCGFESQDFVNSACSQFEHWLSRGGWIASSVSSPAMVWVPGQLRNPKIMWSLLCTTASLGSSPYLASSLAPLSVPVPRKGKHRRHTELLLTPQTNWKHYRNATSKHISSGRRKSLVIYFLRWQRQVMIM